MVTIPVGSDLLNDEHKVCLQGFSTPSWKVKFQLRNSILRVTDFFHWIGACFALEYGKCISDVSLQIILVFIMSFKPFLKTTNSFHQKLTWERCLLKLTGLQKPLLLGSELGNWRERSSCIVLSASSLRPGVDEMTVTGNGAKQFMPQGTSKEPGKCCPLGT